MPSLLTELDTEPAATRARALADRFTLPLDERKWRGNPGNFAGSGVGSSLDFQDHRNYLPGDDPRHINWQAYARSGDYTLKLYREEVRPIVEIILDASGSMFADADKAERTLELLYLSFFSVERSGGTARVFLTKGAEWRPIDPVAISTHYWIDQADELDSDANSAAPPAVGSLPLRQRSLRVFISDLLFRSTPEPLVQALQRNNGRTIFLCPFAPSESDPQWDGNYEFVDTEDDTHHDRRVDASLLKGYLKAYHLHFARWKEAAMRAQSPFARLSAMGTFEEAAQKEAIPSGAIQLA